MTAWAVLGRAETIVSRAPGKAPRNRVRVGSPRRDRSRPFALAEHAAHLCAEVPEAGLPRIRLERLAQHFNCVRVVAAVQAAVARSTASADLPSAYAPGAVTTSASAKGIGFKGGRIQRGAANE